MKDDFDIINELESSGSEITPRFISEKFDMVMSDSIELFSAWKLSKQKPICEDC